MSVRFIASIPQLREAAIALLNVSEGLESKACGHMLSVERFIGVSSQVVTKRSRAAARRFSFPAQCVR